MTMGEIPRFKMVESEEEVRVPISARPRAIPIAVAIALLVPLVPEFRS